MEPRFENLAQDFFRWSLLHSWYKHIPLSGATHWAYERVGEYPNRHLGKFYEVTDHSGQRWWFSHEKPEGIKSYPFRVGPFLRGLERSQMCYHGLDIIIDDAGKDVFIKWIGDNYPKWKHYTYDDWLDLYVKNDPTIFELFKTEQYNYFYNLVDEIYKDEPSIRKWYNWRPLLPV